MSSLSARHPRYAIFLVVLLFFCLLFFTNTTPKINANLLQRPPSGTHTADQIKLSEVYYQEHLKDRQKMIRKYGPTPDLVDSFPTHGEFYTLWDFFTASFQCPHRVQRIGTLGDGGKWVCGFERIAEKKSCVVYSVGINGESSFEASILERAPGCQVYGYDFSVKSFGPEITTSPYLSNRAHFWPYALGGTDINDSTGDSKFQTYTLDTLMKKNGHSFIDILKIDIEGSEFEALDAFFDAHDHFTPSTSPVAHLPSGNRKAWAPTLPIGQLQLEIHARDGPYENFGMFLKWWEKLERMGLRPFWTEPNLVYVNIVRGAKPELAEYSFINIRGDHALVSDPHSGV